MSEYRFTLPIYLTFKLKTKKDRKISINLNWFRSSHHRDYEKAKAQYCEEMAEQIKAFDPLPDDAKFKIHYDFYAAANNGPDLDNFTGAAKKFFQDALVKYGFIHDDNVNYIIANSEKYCGIDTKNPRIEAKVIVYD